MLTSVKWFQALMLENLQRTSTHHVGLQPNSQVSQTSCERCLVCAQRGTISEANALFESVPQIGEEMSQNSFIKQYLAKQQELLRQRLEREAREAIDTEGKSPPG